MASNRLRSYQTGGPSGRDEGTRTLTAKVRTKGAGKGEVKTAGVTLRCSDSKSGELCNWMQAQFREITRRVENETSDRKRSVERRKALSGKTG